jgi:RNA polymerase sigma factor (sigma-70 family)
MVLGVCRRVLTNAEDAEDAFQATFLVLVRKGASVRPREMVGNWLYGVAYRTALEARGAIARRRAIEKQVQAMPHPAIEPKLEESWQELRPLLDQELSRLPEKYRLPVILCDLEGRSRREVARQLGVPDGTLSNRLATARQMLARRLTRRGLTIPSAALATALAQSAVSAAVPAALIVSTTQTAALLAAGGAVSAIPAKVVALMEGVIKTMLLTKLKTVAVVLLLVGLAGASVGMLTYPAAARQGKAKAEAGSNPQEPKVPIAKAAPPNRQDKKIESKLSATINVKYDKTALKKVLDDLQTKMGINFVVDWASLKEQDISPDTPITLLLKDVTVRTALKQVLSATGMGTYTVQDGILTVTSTSAAQEKLIRRVYSVADLVDTTKEDEGAILLRIITRTVLPDSWIDKGGRGAIEYFPQGRSLVINQTYDAQEEIQLLLEDLRNAKKEQDKGKEAEAGV